MESDLLLRCVCLALGMVPGCLVPGVLERRALPEYAELSAAAGESLAVLMAGLVCGVLYPLQAQWAICYGAFGAAAGTIFPLNAKPGRGTGLTAVCVWLCFSLPVTGALCCLAGWALGILIYHRQLGLALAPVFAVPVALVQYGTETAIVTGIGAVLALAGQIPFVRRRLYHIF